MTARVSVLAIKACRGFAPGEHEQCSIPGCPRSPRNRAEIMGWPAGRVCRAHAVEWRTAWDRALAGDVVDPAEVAA